MLLEHQYYEVVGSEQESSLSAAYTIRLLPDCSVYAGHFPGNPVCPGVCNIETIRECAMILTGQQLHFTDIKLCRLKAIATPTASPVLTVRLKATPIDGGFTIEASIDNPTQVFMQLKGTLMADPTKLQNL